MDLSFLRIEISLGWRFLRIGALCIMFSYGFRTCSFSKVIGCLFNQHFTRHCRHFLSNFSFQLCLLYYRLHNLLSQYWLNLFRLRDSFIPVFKLHFLNIFNLIIITFQFNIWLYHFYGLLFPHLLLRLWRIIRHYRDVWCLSHNIIPHHIITLHRPVHGYPGTRLPCLRYFHPRLPHW